MQLSDVTPPQESPQRRYSALHRAIERGLESDELWSELADVCLELGLDDEAVRCARRLRQRAAQLALESKLERRRAAAGHPARPASARPAVAPAASDAGPAAPPEADAGPAAPVEAAAPVAPTEPGPRADRFEIEGLAEHLGDALQFQFQQHMPWLVLFATLSFPAVVGLGGHLTGGGSPLLLGALAALPGLCVLAIVGAMSRRILVTSSNGEADVPRLGELGPLLADAARFLADAALVVTLLLGPGLVALQHGAPVTTALPALLIGLSFVPLGFGLRQIRRDLGSLSPVTLVRGVSRCGLGYAGIAAISLLLFAPAGLVAWAVLGRPVWVQISVLGPLCVLPLFVVSRLLGTWLDSMRLELGAVLLGPRPAAPRDVRELVGAPAAGVTGPRFLRRPEGLAHFETPLRHARRSRGANTPAAPASPTAAPAAPATPAAPAAPPLREIEGRGPVRKPVLTDSPDLSHMPGAVVVSGDERVRHGAAARH
ncbi:MAG: hypothetical protein FJ265_09765 [Planctomycetes bacterium]|nr:hypothetical protein [Planctomycetota bacterium]